MKSTRIIYIVLAIILASCTTNTPEQYFDRTTLVTNKFTNFGVSFFNYLEGMKKTNQLHIYDDKGAHPTDSYLEYFKNFTLNNINTDIQKIKDLKPTDETKEMINLSLDLHNYIKNVYETEYINILTMMDEGKPKEEIQKAITDMENKSLSVVTKKYQKLWDVAMPYAEKNGIKVVTH